MSFALIEKIMIFSLLIIRSNEFFDGRVPMIALKDSTSYGYNFTVKERIFVESVVLYVNKTDTRSCEKTDCELKLLIRNETSPILELNFQTWDFENNANRRREFVIFDKKIVLSPEVRYSFSLNKSQGLKLSIGRFSAYSKHFNLRINQDEDTFYAGFVFGTKIDEPAPTVQEIEKIEINETELEEEDKVSGDELEVEKACTKSGINSTQENGLEMYDLLPTKPKSIEEMTSDEIDLLIERTQREIDDLEGGKTPQDELDLWLKRQHPIFNISTSGLRAFTSMTQLTLLAFVLLVLN